MKTDQNYKWNSIKRDSRYFYSRWDKIRQIQDYCFEVSNHACSGHIYFIDNVLESEPSEFFSKRENWVFVTDHFKQHWGILFVFHEPDKTPSVTVPIRVILLSGSDLEPKNLPTRVCPHPSIPAHGHSLKPIWNLACFEKFVIIRKQKHYNKVLKLNLPK